MNRLGNTKDPTHRRIPTRPERSHQLVPRVQDQGVPRRAFWTCSSVFVLFNLSTKKFAMSAARCGPVVHRDRDIPLGLKREFGVAEEFLHCFLDRKRGDVVCVDEVELGDGTG